VVAGEARKKVRLVISGKMVGVHGEKAKSAAKKKAKARDRAPEIFWGI